jgi:hypothetical protein
LLSCGASHAAPRKPKRAASKPKTSAKAAVKPDAAPAKPADDPRWEQHPVLKRLKELRDAKVSAVERARLGQRLYRDEMVNPTPRVPPYTDYLTHDYVMAQITKRLAELDTDVPTMKTAWEGANPGHVKDSLTLFLALKGQPGMKEGIVKLLEDRGNLMRLRELAATVLGTLAITDFDSKAGDVLAKVIREDNQSQYRVVAPTADNPEETVFVMFPVRRAAADAIKEMDKKGLLLASYVTRAAETVQVEVKLEKPRKSN